MSLQSSWIPFCVAEFTYICQAAAFLSLEKVLLWVYLVLVQSARHELLILHWFLQVALYDSKYCLRSLHVHCLPSPERWCQGSTDDVLSQLHSMCCRGEGYARGVQDAQVLRLYRLEHPLQNRIVVAR